MFLNVEGEPSLYPSLSQSNPAPRRSFLVVLVCMNECIIEIDVCLIQRGCVGSKRGFINIQM